jgi:hypothetical protein
MNQSKKQTHTTSRDDEHDRLTITMRRGYSSFFKRVARELDIKPSELARRSFRDILERLARTNNLSHETKLELEQIRKKYGSGDLF